MDRGPEVRQLPRKNKKIEDNVTVSQGAQEKDRLASLSRGLVFLQRKPKNKVDIRIIEIMVSGISPVLAF